LDGYRPEAILFDMDGVLADVSESYRQAIILTGTCAALLCCTSTLAITDANPCRYHHDMMKAKHFGVEATYADVAKLKAAGDANNDWKLTHRLIANTKSAVGTSLPTLQEVTDKFEELYQVCLASYPPARPHSSTSCVCVWLKQNKGTAEVAGLWETERLIINISLFERLSAKCPLLGVVTGERRKSPLHRCLITLHRPLTTTAPRPPKA